MLGITLEINGKEEWVDIEITNYSPFRSGKVGHPDNWLPDEDEVLEVAVKLDGKDITSEITESQYEDCCYAALDRIRNFGNEYDE